METNATSNGTEVPKLNRQTLFMQLREQMLDRIRVGQYKRGQLPNEGDLAREFGVSSGTMRKALDLLEAEGVVARQQGRGTFVLNGRPTKCPHCGARKRVRAAT